MAHVKFGVCDVRGVFADVCGCLDDRDRTRSSEQATESKTHVAGLQVHVGRIRCTFSSLSISKAVSGAGGR